MKHKAHNEEMKCNPESGERASRMSNDDEAEDGGERGREGEELLRGGWTRVRVKGMIEPAPALRSHECPSPESKDPILVVEWKTPASPNY
jgi:hypothetical protein